ADFFLYFIPSSPHAIRCPGRRVRSRSDISACHRDTISGTSDQLPVLRESPIFASSLQCFAQYQS
ncbi:hypothetical protein SERLADRAFT_453378, partial [Serpula lacrymans var. lacrymans S7.9]